MNFFQAQDNARRNTWKLLLLFTSAVVATIAIVYAGLHFVFLGGLRGGFVAEGWYQINQVLLLDVTIGVLALISVGSIYKALVLSGDGSRVAESLGGRPLSASTRDAGERRLLNIVDEMAIAAGTAPPLVYVLPDANINAFAAGTTPCNAVIGVTRGAMQHLSREQMQGVIAHEFSHIMNGDMRLNLRLTAIIHGIMLLGYLGYFILRGSFYSSAGSRRDQGGLIFVGIALVVAGTVGTFFGSWIRAAVSRQREYLADAAAVQYTRNPQGIAGALERIGQLGGLIKSGYETEHTRAYKRQQLIGLGSQLEAGDISSKHAIEYSHMFFSKGVRVNFSNPFATHPPLQSRIKRIIPQWSEQALLNTAATAGTPLQEPTKRSMEPPAAAEKPAAAYNRLLAGGAAVGFAAAAGVRQIGTINAKSVESASRVVKQMPAVLVTATEEPYAARALIYAILLDKKHQLIRDTQLAYLEANADDGVYALVRKLMPDINFLKPAAVLPLVQRSLPALRQLSVRQYRLFLTNMAELVAADQTIELFEWCVQAVICHALHDNFAKYPRASLGGDKQAAMAYALSILARVSQPDAAAATVTAGESAGLRLAYSPREFNPKELFQAMQQLANLPPKRKEQFVNAAMACAAHNGHIDANEAALLRAYFMILDCPLPLEIAE